MYGPSPVVFCRSNFPHKDLRTRIMVHYIHLDTQTSSLFHKTNIHRCCACYRHHTVRICPQCHCRIARHQHSKYLANMSSLYKPSRVQWCIANCIHRHLQSHRRRTPLPFPIPALDLHTLAASCRLTVLWLCFRTSNPAQSRIRPSIHHHLASSHRRKAL